MPASVAARDRAPARARRTRRRARRGWPSRTPRRRRAPARRRPGAGRVAAAPRAARAAARRPRRSSRRSARTPRGRARGRRPRARARPRPASRRASACTGSPVKSIAAAEHVGELGPRPRVRRARRGPPGGARAAAGPEVSASATPSASSTCMRCSGGGRLLERAPQVGDGALRRARCATASPPARCRSVGRPGGAAAGREQQLRRDLLDRARRPRGASPPRARARARARRAGARGRRRRGRADGRSRAAARAGRSRRG